MRFGVALYFFLIFIVSVSGYASDAAANISGPTTSATGRYTLTHTTKAEYLKTGIFFAGGGSSYGSIPVGNGSTDIYTNDSGMYTYSAQADGPCLLYDPTTRRCEEYGEPLVYGSHTVYVTITPNKPASIGFQSDLSGPTGFIDTDGKYTLVWGTSKQDSQDPYVSGYQWCQEKDGVWQAESSCLTVENNQLSIDFPTTTGAMPSGNYRYKVRAFVSVGPYYQYSDWIVSDSLEVKHYPDEPYWQEPGGNTLPSTNFALGWGMEDSDSIDHYELRWSGDGINYWEIPLNNGLNSGNPAKLTSTEVDLANLINPTVPETPDTLVPILVDDITVFVPKSRDVEYLDSYWFQVRGCNTAGCGNWSTKQLSVPAAPEPQFSSDLPDEFFKTDQTITWEDVGAKSYRLRRMKKGCVESEPGNSCWEIVYYTTSVFEYFVGGGTPGTYLYELEACNEFGKCSSVSSTWIKVHNLANVDGDPAVTTEVVDTPGSLAYSADVSATGNAIVKVPLQAAPGVNGLQPNLSLHYTSARFQKRMTEALPEDFLGYGWRLGGLSKIRRCTVNRPKYTKILLDDTDSLCLDGEPLVLVSGNHWQEGAQYRTLRDGFRLIELQKTDNGKVWFTVKSPNGSTSEYGATQDSRLRGEETTHFGWTLNKITDAFGNTMEYKYHRDIIEGINYPLEITYGNQGDAKIEFQYGTRTDAPPVPLQEIPQKQLVLLHHIRVHLDGVLQREYKLISEEELAGEHFRRLKQVQLCAYSEDGDRQCLKPLDFKWAFDDLAHYEDFETGIERITNGLDAQTEFTLKRISSSAGERTVAPFNEGSALFGPDGSIPDVSPVTPNEDENYRTVVTEVKRSNGHNGGWHTTEYAYQGYGLSSDKGWGFLGYRAQRIYDTAADIVTYRQYRQDFPFFGKIARQIQYKTDYQFGEMLTNQRFSYDALELNSGGNTTYFPYIAQRIDTLLEGDQPPLGYVVSDSVPQAMSYGNAGDLLSGAVNTTRVIETTQINDSQSIWGEALPISQYGNVRRSVESTTVLDNRVNGSWLIGFPSAKEQRYFSGDTSGTPDQQSSSSMTPYGNTNRVKTAVQYPGDAKYQMEVTYTYDTYGNVASESAKGNVDASTNNVGTQTRSTSVVGDFLDGRYATKLTNALQHTIELKYDPRFGSVSKITDHNDQSTRIQYDPFGRESSRTNTDRLNTDKVKFDSKYDFCHGNCPVVSEVQASYYVETTSDITPVTKYYYDQLGRLIQQDTKAFSGDFVSRRAITYDPLGRMDTETAPFLAPAEGGFSGSKPITRYEYDLRNRLDYIHKAGGGSVDINYSVVNGSSGKEIKVEVTESVVGNSGTNTQVQESYYDLTGDLARTVDDATGTAVTTDYTYYGSGLPKTVLVSGDTHDIESSFVFDYAGFRTSLTDPNMGTVTSRYNAFGELDQQSDNKNQSITYLYDKLGRLLEQRDDDGLAKWDYDATNSVGSLASRSYTENGSQVFFESYTYRYSDGELDTINTQLLAGGVSRSYQHQYGYDSYGRMNKMVYPSEVEAHYHYNDRGYVQSLSRDAAGNNPLQTFDSINAWGQVERESYGNGLVTNRTYNPNTGRLETIKTGGGQVQNNEYRWRTNGTLESRLSYSASQALQKQEDFSYDGLNRLRYATMQVGSDRQLSTQYDKLGNILSKTSSVSNDTQVSGYQYGEFGNAGPNAVSSVTINGISHSLHYDANGAIERYDAASGDDKWIRWNARQLPTEIVLGSSQGDSTPTARDRFQYGPNGQRFYRESSWMEDGQLKTEKAFIVGSYEEQIPADASILAIEKTTLAGSVQHIAITDLTGTSGEYQYLHRDHLGSIEKITDEAGLEILNLAFNPDGSRRQGDWSGDLDQQQLLELLATQGLTTKRGYTGHEHLDRTGLIHMNGRIYDPTLGRFLSPDPLVQAPTYSQSWNRYSYVFNNPLSFTDPSGYAASEQDERPKVVDEPNDSSGQGSQPPAPIPEVTTYGDPSSSPTDLIIPYVFDSNGRLVLANPFNRLGGLPSSFLEDDVEEEQEEREQDDSECTQNGGCVSVTVDKNGHNAQKGDGFFKGLWKKATGWHFEGRDTRNGNLPSYGQATGQGSEWTLLSPEQSIFHDNSVGKPELKFIHPDGREAVFNGDTLNLVTDPKYVGTYNYVNPAPVPDKWYDVGGWSVYAGKGLGHLVLDVAPYAAGGNVRGEN
ncbi:RHS repeat-associated core domain-containing protein [Microbulbifer sp. VTAC004]|uniref:RHS repeat-associated core domain-containing protein n=1 Tax=Microbulbifer sp. VTAC004 TaxID=3243386 RepID=UPI004039DE14